MTTVAATKDAIASDSLVNDGGTRAKGKKVFKGKRGIVGVAGDFVQARMFIDWFFDRRKKKPDPDSDFEALVLTPNGTLYVWYPDLTHIEVDDDYWAIGSGRDAALSALSLGHDLTAAVQAACAVDINTGLPVVLIER